MKKLVLRMAFAAIALSVSISAQAETEKIMKQEDHFQITVLKKATPKKMLSKLEPKEMVYLKEVVSVGNNEVKDNQKFQGKSAYNYAFRQNNDVIVYVGFDNRDDEPLAAISIAEYINSDPMTQTVLFVPGGKTNSVPVMNSDQHKNLTGNEACADLFVGISEKINCEWSVSVDKVE